MWKSVENAGIFDNKENSEDDETLLHHRWIQYSAASSLETRLYNSGRICDYLKYTRSFTAYLALLHHRWIQCSVASPRTCL